MGTHSKPNDEHAASALWGERPRARGWTRKLVIGVAILLIATGISLESRLESRTERISMSADVVSTPAEARARLDSMQERLDRFLAEHDRQDLGSAREILDRIRIVEQPSGDHPIELRYEVHWYSPARERERAEIARRVFSQLVRDVGPGLPEDWIVGIGD